MTDVQPKYYATNTKALTLGECLRMGGGAFGVWVWFLTRFSAPMEDKQLLPVLYDSIEARLEDFSDEMRVRVEEVTAQFVEQGFRPIGYQRFPEDRDKKVLDTGGVYYLSADGRVIGSLAIVVRENPLASEPDYAESAGVTVVDEQGNSLAVGNDKNYMDPLPGSKVIYRKGTDVKGLLKRLEKEQARWNKRLRTFTGWHDVRPTMEKGEIDSFLHRRDVRGLFVEVTDEPSPRLRKHLTRNERNWAKWSGKADLEIVPVTMRFEFLSSVEDQAEQLAEKLESLGFHSQAIRVGPKVYQVSARMNRVWTLDLLQEVTRNVAELPDGLYTWLESVTCEFS